MFFDISRYAGPIAQVGILGVAAVSAVINFTFWADRGDMAAAWLTVALELVAIGGFVMVIHHWSRHRLTALGALAVTLLSAGWGALSMTERLSSEAHQRTVDAAQASPAYAQAQADLAVAASLYRAALADRVPERLGPLTTEQRSLDLERRRGALKAERDQAHARLDALTPSQPAFEPLAWLRGWGTMLAVLLGLSVFGFRHTQPEAGKAVESEPRPLTPSELGKLGAAAKRAKREAEAQQRERRNARRRELRALRSGKVPEQWSAELFGQLPN